MHDFIMKRVSNKFGTYSSWTRDVDIRQADWISKINNWNRAQSFRFLCTESRIERYPNGFQQRSFGVAIDIVEWQRTILSLTWKMNVRKTRSKWKFHNHFKTRNPGIITGLRLDEDFLFGNLTRLPKTNFFSSFKLIEPDIVKQNTRFIFCCERSFFLRFCS